MSEQWARQLYVLHLLSGYLGASHCSKTEEIQKWPRALVSAPDKSGVPYKRRGPDGIWLRNGEQVQMKWLGSQQTLRVRLHMAVSRER
jgi:hypothetical protein